MLFIIVAAFVFVILVDLLPLIKKKAKKEIIIFVVMLNFCLFVSICLVLDIKLPEVIKLIDDFMKKIGLSWEK